MRKPAIFLDRDGVLIHETNYLNEVEQICLYEDIPQGLRKLKDAGYWLIMVTNQSGVARGYFTKSFVRDVFKEINQKLDKWEVQLDGFYYCPHHLLGHPPYNIDCDCRKPAPGMIHQAIAEFDIDMSNSFMIGDKICDVELGLNVGIESILLLTGHGREERSKVALKYPNIPILPSFSDGVDSILINS